MHSNRTSSSSYSRNQRSKGKDCNPTAPPHHHVAETSVVEQGDVGANDLWGVQVDVGLIEVDRVHSCSVQTYRARRVVFQGLVQDLSIYIAFGTKFIVWRSWA